MRVKINLILTVEGRLSCCNKQGSAAPAPFRAVDRRSRHHRDLRGEASAVQGDARVIASDGKEKGRRLNPFTKLKRILDLDNRVIFANFMVSLVNATIQAHPTTACFIRPAPQDEHDTPDNDS